MSDTAVRRWAWVGFLSLTLIYAAAGVLSLLSRSVDPLLVLTASFPLVGILILSRQPRNAIGWILLGIGLCWALTGFLDAHGRYALVTRPGALPFGDVAVILGSPLWAPAIGLIGVFLILLFPDGRLPSPRWKVLAWIAAVGIAGIYLVIVLTPGPLTDDGYPDLMNPLGLEILKPLDQAPYALVPILPLCIVASAVSLVQRYRRSQGLERLQLKWLAAAAATVALVFLAAVLSSLGSAWGQPDTPTWAQTLQNVAVGSFILIPTAIGFAILKHRLFDIDIVINKAVVFATLAGFITLVYVAIVVGIGAAIGQGSRPNLGLSILATAIVAVAFQPVRERMQRFSNRLVYGKRATPYEVLSDFASRMGSAYAMEDLLPRMARTLAEGTGARRAAVWLNVGGHIEAEATWPPEESIERLPLTNRELPELDATLALPVHYQDELLGAISLTKPPQERLTPGEEKLARDLASQAGLVLRNVRLTEELLQRLKELQASRQRIVAAQDEERRRLERNIHDGAQQQLVALAVKVRLARSLTAKDPGKAASMLDQVGEEIGSALEELRDLARGIYPPLLADQGLVAALEAQARKAPLPVSVDADGIGRYPQETEAAVYFCAMEALQNVAKYAKATRAQVVLRERDGHLSFRVADDGMGFDTRTASSGSGLQGMADRLAALNGELDVASAPGGGTQVTGRLPLDAAAR